MGWAGASIDLGAGHKAPRAADGALAPAMRQGSKYFSIGTGHCSRVPAAAFIQVSAPVGLGGCGRAALLAGSAMQATICLSVVSI